MPKLCARVPPVGIANSGVEGKLPAAAPGTSLIPAGLDSVTRLTGCGSATVSECRGTRRGGGLRPFGVEEAAGDCNGVAGGSDDTDCPLSINTRVAPSATRTHNPTASQTRRQFHRTRVLTCGRLSGGSVDFSAAIWTLIRIDWLVMLVSL